MGQLAVLLGDTDTKAWPGLEHRCSSCPQDYRADAQHCSLPGTKRVMNLGKLQREKEHSLNLFYVLGDRYC